ncbi:MAG: hypothetical protein ACRDZT_04160 [Acidimicrobiales bacterium]
MKFDLKRLSSLDRLIAGGAGVVFIAAFLPWWGYSGPLGLAYSASVDGWSAGFTAWAGTLLLFGAGVYVVLRRSGTSMPSTPVGPSVLVAGVAGLGLLLVVVRWLTLPSVHGGAAGSIGAKYGIWLAIIAGVVEVAAAVVEMRASGEPLPWQPARQDVVIAAAKDGLENPSTAGD